jgi:hypothetical protein
MSRAEEQRSAFVEDCLAREAQSANGAMAVLKLDGLVFKVDMHAGQFGGREGGRVP